MFSIFKSKDKEQKKQDKSKQSEAFESKEQSEVDTIEQSKRQTISDHLLTDAIINYKDEQLRKNIKHASLNKKAVSESGEIICDDPPLVLAIDYHNSYAFEALMDAGAKIDVLNKDGSPAFDRAVMSGQYSVVQRMLMSGANVNSFHGMSVLQTALVAFSDWQLIKNGKWKDAATQKMLLEWFEQRGQFATNNPQNGVPFPKKQGESVVVQYEGPLEIISLMLSYPDIQPWVTSETNNSPYTILNDLTYFERYSKAKPDCGYRAFTEDLGPTRVDFIYKLRNRNGSSEFSIYVEYDFQKIKDKLESYLKNKFGTIDIHKIASSLHTKIQATISNNFEQQKDPIERRIGELLKNDTANRSIDRYIDTVSRKLDIMLDAYKQLSSGLFQRTKETKADYAAKILTFVGEHAPSPFGIVFGAFGVLLDKGLDIREKQRYDRIAHLLPMDRTLKEFCREIACRLADSTIKSFIAQSGNPNAVKIEDSEDLARKSFIIAIYYIYNVDKLSIDPNLPAKERAQKFADLIVANTQSSEVLMKLISEKVNSSIATATHKSVSSSSAVMLNGYASANKKTEMKGTNGKQVVSYEKTYALDYVYDKEKCSIM